MICSPYDFYLNITIIGNKNPVKLKKVRFIRRSVAKRMVIITLFRLRLSNENQLGL